MNELNLGTGKIGSLIAKFSVPCVISMVVAALYNIVDQIFIGWSETGAYGNAATNIVYPFTVLALGLALLVGDGAAAGFSIALGKGDRTQANRNIGNGLVLLVCASLILCVIGFIYKTQILALFGGNPAEVECYGYAMDYFTIICIGIPFYMFGQGMNGSIRADGSPKFAMACTLAGAITNLIFDPVLIFVLTEESGSDIFAQIGQPTEGLERIHCVGNVIFHSFDRKMYGKCRWWKKTAQKGIAEKLTIRSGNTIQKLLEKAEK